MDCSKLPDHEHCNGCFEEFEEGYDVIEIEDGSGGYLRVCCALTDHEEAALVALVKLEKLREALGD